MRFEPSQDLACIVLAAGPSSRLGQPKQLVEFSGQPLVARAAALAKRCCGRGVIVVTGAHHDAVQDALSGTDVTAVYNPSWQAGMGSSLGQGAAMLRRDAPAVLILLADQPLVELADVEKLVTAWQTNSDCIVAASYDSATGVPAIFPQRCFGELARLRGDRGARKIISDDERVVEVAMPNAAFDLDTPEALARMRQIESELSERRTRAT